MKHTLDTNIIVTLRNQYPRDVFGTLWDRVETAVASGDVCICAEVLRELHRGGDELHKWAKSLPGFICSITAQEMKVAQEISSAHPGWVRGNTNAADPFLIAHAESEGLCVVSNERLAGPAVADHNQKVPNVAAERSVSCVDLIGFVRAKSWTF